MSHQPLQGSMHEHHKPGNDEVEAGHHAALDPEPPTTDMNHHANVPTKNAQTANQAAAYAPQAGSYKGHSNLLPQAPAGHVPTPLYMSLPAHSGPTPPRCAPKATSARMHASYKRHALVHHLSCAPRGSDPLASVSMVCCWSHTLAQTSASKRKMNGSSVQGSLSHHSW